MKFFKKHAYTVPARATRRFCLRALLKNEFCGFCGSQCCESATEHPNVMCMKSERTGEAWIRDGGGGSQK